MVHRHPRSYLTFDFPLVELPRSRSTNGPSLQRKSQPELTVNYGRHERGGLIPDATTLRGKNPFCRRLGTEIPRVPLIPNFEVPAVQLLVIRTADGRAAGGCSRIAHIPHRNDVDEDNRNHRPSLRKYAESPSG